LRDLCLLTFACSSNPNQAAKHFFAQRQGKQFRPTIVMLMAKACAPDPTAHTTGPVHDKQAMLGQVRHGITHDAL
jgi:geranylgeranyl pyrophosphate synthase